MKVSYDLNNIFLGDKRIEINFSYFLEFYKCCFAIATIY